jgi:hypothetical protein
MSEVEVSAPVQVTKAANTQDIIDLYMSGKNYYQVALEVFGFESDEAVAKVRATLEDAEAKGAFKVKKTKEDKKAN